MAISPITATPIPTLPPPMPPVPAGAVAALAQTDKSPPKEHGGTNQQNLSSKDERETIALLESMDATNPQSAVLSRQAVTARSGYGQQGAGASGAAAELTETGLTDALPLSEHLPPPPSDTSNLTTTVVSVAGKLINQLLQLTQQQGTAVAIHGSKPVLTSTPAAVSTPEIAKALENTIEHSGLFYESHLGELTQNERSLAELMQEPQAQQPPTSASLPSTASSAPASATPQAETLNATLSQLVAQQLNTLEQNRIVWQGEIWPGQPMRWEVKEDTSQQHSSPQAGADNESQQRIWRSDVQFELPHLGSLKASIFYKNGQVQVQINTDDERAATALRGHGAQLAEALNDVGSHLNSLQVQTTPDNSS